MGRGALAPQRSAPAFSFLPAVIPEISVQGCGGPKFSAPARLRVVVRRAIELKKERPARPLALPTALRLIAIVQP